MIERAQLEARLVTLREQREAQGRQALDLQQALRTADRACAQLDGAILVLCEVLGTNDASTTGATPEEDRHS